MTDSKTIFLPKKINQLNTIQTSLIDILNWKMLSLFQRMIIHHIFVSGPCQLPRILHGTYMSEYRSGLIIANGSSVTFHCSGEYYPSPSHEIQCIMGELQPSISICRHPSGVDPEISEGHYLGGSDIVKGGAITVFGHYAKGNPCGPPAK